MPVIVSTMPPMRSERSDSSLMAVPTCSDERTAWPMTSLAACAAPTPSSASAATIARSIVCTKSATRVTAMIGYATSWPGPW